MYFIAILTSIFLSTIAFAVDDGPLESLCGSSDLVHVNAFQGNDDFSRYFVRARKQSVGVIVRNNLKRYCTGSMISHDLMLTARHCIQYKRPDNLKVIFSYELNRKGEETKEYTYLVKSILETGKNEKLDYAILKLDGRPGLTHGYSALANSDTPIEQDEPIILLQHPNGEPMQLDVGHIKRIENKMIEYDDLDTLGGSSGAGLLNADGKIIGVHVLGGCFKIGGSNKAVSIKAIRKASKVIQKYNL